MRHDDGAMEQSALDIIRHTLHYIPDTVLSQVSMIEINRKKLKAAFILHLFSATFVLLAFQNFVSDVYARDSNFQNIDHFQGFLFINILFHFCLIWSLAQPGMIEPMVITGIVNILAIIFEIVFLSVFWPTVRRLQNNPLITGLHSNCQPIAGQHQPHHLLLRDGRH